MKITLNRILEILLAILSMFGCYLVANISIQFQLIGWAIFIIADIIGIVFAIKNKYWFMLIQFLFFTVMAINGVVGRI